MASDSTSNLAIVKSTYEGATSEENGRNLAAHAASDITWIEAAGFPYAGTYVGLDQIRSGVFSRLANEWVGYRFEPEDYLAQGDKVIAYGTYHGINRATGKAMSARVAHLWKLTDGKIVAFEQFVDSQPVVDAAS